MERQEVIERLRLEKIEAEKAWHDHGCAEGKIWAEYADYERLVHYAEMDPQNFTKPAEEDRENYWPAGSGDEVMPSEHLKECFWQGWLKGVKEFYHALEGEL